MAVIFNSFYFYDFSERTQISNIAGKLLKTIDAADKNTSIDIAGLSGGVYIVKVINKEGVVVKKFVKE